MMVADEDVAKLWPAPPAFAWVYDITKEQLPVPISTFQVPGLDKDGSPQPAMTGCHQPSERFTGTIVPFAWFAQGLRLVDFADPFAPQGDRSLSCPMRRPAPIVPSSNDVTIDSRGLIYLVDRVNGVDIIEASAFAETKSEHERANAQGRLSDRQEEPEPAVSSGGARRRLHLRVRPGREGRQRQHDLRHDRGGDRRHDRSRSSASSRRRARRSPTWCG